MSFSVARAVLQFVFVEVQHSGDVGVSLVVAGARFGDVVLLFLVAGATCRVSFSAGAIFV